MSAVLNLVKDSTPDPRPSQALAGQTTAPVLAVHPLQAQLRERAAEAGERLVMAFVEELDAAVQSLLAESRNAMESRAVMDLGSALSLNRPALVRGFIAALKSRFDPLKKPGAPGVLDLDRLCLLPTEDMEENIALAHLSQLAEQKAGENGRQLLARLQWASRDLGLPALAQALCAQTLPNCFAQAFRQAGLATAERVLAYRLVESHALNGWTGVVQSALQLLDQMGLNRARPLSGSLSGRLLPVAAQDAAPMISTATMQTLREARASLAHGTDGALASALLRAVEPPFGGSDAGLITALAGAWMDSLLAEPELPPAFAPDLESLRLVVIKAALCDITFFVQPLHPVRQAVDELAQQAAFIGMQGYSLAPLRLSLKEVAARVSIHGQFALDALSMLPPLDPDLALRFHQQMAKDHEHRGEKLLHRVRTLAAREIDARTLDVSLPAAARAALTRGFLPLLSTLLLRHGAASPQTRQARQLLERFVDSFALCCQQDERRSVLDELCKTLQGTGLSDSHVAGVRTELERAYAELEEEAQTNLSHAGAASAQREIDDILLGLAAPATELLPREVPVPSSRPTASSDARSPTSADQYAASSSAALATPAQRLLKPGQWFRVRDYKRGDDRWLSLTGVHIEQDRVSFSGFDGVTVFAMRASQFLEDLGSGLAEPLNPDAGVQQALQSLRARPSAVPARLHSFG